MELIYHKEKLRQQNHSNNNNNIGMPLIKRQPVNVLDTLHWGTSVRHHHPRPQMYQHDLISDYRASEHQSGGGAGHHFNTPSMLSSSRGQEQTMMMGSSTAAMTRTIAKTTTNLA